MEFSALVARACADCDDDLEHCHGASLVHIDGSVECTDEATCRLAAELHRFVMRCEDDECLEVVGSEEVLRVSA